MSLTCEPPVKKIKVDASFFKPLSDKVASQLDWSKRNTLLVGKSKTLGDLSNCKVSVAAFDLDGTLIKPKTGKRYPSDQYDWQFCSPSVAAKVRSAHERGYTVVILSNQGGISLKRGNAKRMEQWKEKLSNVINAIGIPIMIYAATEIDRFRKPRAGMWTEVLNDLGAQSIDIAESFFVGDAAGRAGDHACSDRKLAANLGLKFMTPQEYFLNQDPLPYSWGPFDPSLHLGKSANFEQVFEKINEKDILLCVGSPCSGKSTFCRRIAEPLRYVRINQDTLKSRERCLQVADKHLHKGDSVIVDNTNPDKAVRREWISLARQHKVQIRCLHFNASSELARHNNAVRAFSGTSTEHRELLPGVAFTSFAGRFQTPVVEEGFQDLTTIQFKCDLEQSTVWSRWWAE